jgi:small subunit ribosomal protein S20
VANSAQARKRARQAEKHRQLNASQRSMLRTYLKRVEGALAAGDSDAATEAYKTASPIIDRMAGKGLIHKNKAARHKARLNARIRAIQA